LVLVATRYSKSVGDQPVPAKTEAPDTGGTKPTTSNFGAAIWKKGDFLHEARVDQSVLQLAPFWQNEIPLFLQVNSWACRGVGIRAPDRHRAHNAFSAPR